MKDATDKNAIITFTGTCAGPVVIMTDGLTLKGVGTAIIDGGGVDALTVAGASPVSLIDFEVRNGPTGVLIRNGAHVGLTGVTSRSNSGPGIMIQSDSSGVLNNVSATNNGSVGLAVDDGSSINLKNSILSGNSFEICS